MDELESRPDRPYLGSLLPSEPGPRRRGPRSWGRGRIWIVLGPAFAVSIVVWGAIGIGPAVSAAMGHGTRGYFVAQRPNCGKGGCTWSGQFRLPDGEITRHGTQLLASDPGMTAGAVVPALDTGDPFEVFPRDGSRQWLQPSLFLLFGIGLLAMWTWTVPRGAIRRRRAGRPARGRPGRRLAAWQK